MNKRSLLALLAAIPLVLIAGCGGGGGGSATVRLVNASPGYPSLDLSFGTTTPPQITSVGFGSASSFVSVGSGTQTTNLYISGSSTVSLAQTRTLNKGTNYSIIAYGKAGGLLSLIATENQSAPTSGDAKFSVLDTATDAGPVDVYVYAPTESLTSATAVVSSLPGGSQSAFASIVAGTYTITVTGPGNKADVRLTIPSIALTDQQIATLILTPGPSGYLVNAQLLNQGGTITAYQGTQARVRAVPAVDSNAAVSLNADSTVLLNSVVAPVVPGYVLVNAGSAVSLTGSVNGVALPATPENFVAGTDYTVLVYGSAGAPQIVSLFDDNTLPTNTGTANIRMINAVYGLSGSLNLQINFQPVATNVLYPPTSPVPITNIASSTTALIQVSSPLSTTPLFSYSSAPIASQGVYTLFMFGGLVNTNGVLSASGALVKDR
jgi:hypothetical protein